MVRLALPQRGAPTEETAGLLFVGGRKKRAFGNRYNLLCWDMKADKKLWETPGILLHKKEGSEASSSHAYEVGFEEVFIWNDLAIVHGQYDVIAVNRLPGQELYEQEGSRHGKKKTRWHFRVPLGFVIRKVDMCGEVIVLCGRGSTMALSAVNGQIVWDAREAGEFYAGPFFHEDIAFTVRKSPSEVSFRRTGSGRLLRRLSLPGLTTNRQHPLFAGEGSEGNVAAAEAAEAHPVASADGLLVVNDGLTYYLVDVEKQEIRWSRGATKLDTSRDAAYRMWIDDGRIFVLKPYYAVLENAVLDAATGDMIWRRREGGKKQDATVKKFEKERGSEEDPGAKAATGLVLGSMEFVDGIAYGVKYEMGATTVTLVGMDPKSGNEVMKIREKGYEEPEAYVEPSWSKGCVNVRIQDGNKFEVWQVDVKAKKLVQKTRLEGYGRLGEYGDASAVWQGPYQVVWAFATRKITKP
jgi:hypothetical protein